MAAKKAGVKSYVYNLRMTEATRRKLTKVSKAYGLDPASLLRALIHREEKSVDAGKISVL